MTFDLEKLIAPKSVAVVGASTRDSAVGNRVVTNLKRVGFAGPVYPINPRYQEVGGLRCYPSLGALPETPEAVFVGIPAEQVLPVIEEAARLGVRAAVVNASGFADAGPAGEALQRKLAATARAAGMALCGPNNLGLLNLHDRAGLWTPKAYAQIVPGAVAVISQSGSVAIAISQDSRRIGLSHLITAGNEAVCTAADYLLALTGDPRVRVVMMFLETIRDPRLFAEAAQRAAARGQRILVLKAGRSESGRAAVAAHTGALSGEDRVYDVYFRRHGILRMGDLDEMIETAMLLSRAAGAPPEPRRAIAVTLSGGEAALVADLAGELGLPLAELAPETVAAMRPAFSPYAQPRNPVDAWGLGWDAERFRGILRALLQEPSAGAIALAIDAPAGGGADGHLAEEMADVSIEELAKSGGNKGLVFFNNAGGGDVNAEVRKRLEPHGIPYLLGMRPAVAAIAHWLRARAPAPPAPASPRALPDLARLGEPERFRLLADAGLPMADCVPVRSAADAARTAARLGFPVVLKGTAPSLPHKTEHGLVKLGLAGAAAVEAAYRELDSALARLAPGDPLAAVVVQPMAAGVQLLLGLRNDRQFGSIVVVGLGGTLVEVMDEASLRIGPVDRETARAMLGETKAAKLLAGARGQKPCDIEAALDAIVALSRFGHETAERIAALEINPLIVREKGAGAVGVDVVLEPHREA
jgi:acyl-CoA synthetase (NDP forming)